LYFVSCVESHSKFKLDLSSNEIAIYKGLKKEKTLQFSIRPWAETLPLESESPTLEDAAAAPLHVTRMAPVLASAPSRRPLPHDMLLVSTRPVDPCSSRVHDELHQNREES
jgi:hypothetical protein